jgi:predicted dehydrogenase
LIRIGIVGSNYGRTVLLPAFRNDPRCVVIALAGSDHARTAEIARECGIPTAFSSWEDLLKRADIDAVLIATPPLIQPAIAMRAFERDKAVFIEKPMAATLQAATDMLRASETGVQIGMIDFEFTELLAWKKTKELLDAGAIGRMRHVMVTWNVENQATRKRLKHWKTSAQAGGGTLGNLASHSMHYLEWFGGPITEISARLATLPDDASMEVTATMSLAFASGAAGGFAVSSASYLGSGHRLEFYGEDGTLVLANTTANYMRGFKVFHARRPSAEFEEVAVDPDPIDSLSLDDRIAPVSRLAKRFLDAIEHRTTVSPSFSEGHRAQVLLDAVRRSHELRQTIRINEPAPAEIR